MGLLRLTVDNCFFFKHRLRELCPSIGSAHLTEGLAAGYGWSSHAAFKVAVGSFAPGYEPAIRFDCGALQARLRQMGAAPIENKLIADCLRELPDPCWKEFQRRDRHAEDEWFYCCERTNLPYVYVSRARKYALLHWDCISIDPAYEGGVRGKSARAIMMRLFSCFQSRAKGDSGRPFFEGSAFVGTVNNLLPATACLLADDFFEMLYCATRTSLS